MSKPSPAPRRRFLKTAATGTVAAGAMAAPMVSNAQTTSAALPEHLAGEGHLPRVRHRLRQEGQRHGGRPPEDRGAAGRRRGAGLPAARRASTKGTLDGGHGVVAYHYGKNSALALWGSGPAFGMDPNMVLAWHNYGGGKALLEEIYKSAEHRRRVLPVRPDADAAARLVQEADRQASRT